MRNTKWKKKPSKEIAFTEIECFLEWAATEGGNRGSGFMNPLAVSWGIGHS